MDFYKRIVKTKDAASVLSEKEYKCVSLQAITNEAVKENNKKALKELVEEINGHLADLRAIKDDNNAKNKDKCATLIQKFEECLVKIVNTNFFDVLSPLTGQLQELQNLTNVAIRDNNVEELKKLAERMERNIAIVKEIPEVKNARNSENGDERILETVNKYTSLLNKVLAHINAQRVHISEPVLVETTQKTVNESIQEQDTVRHVPNKIVLNEVEERLKLMRQKRLNRLSTFVDQQAQLSEQRSRENSPKNSANTNKGSENLGLVPEQAEYENVNRPFEIVKYKAEQKKSEEKHFGSVDEKVQTGFVSPLKTSVGKGVVTTSFSNKNVAVAASSTAKFKEKSPPPLKINADKDASKEDKAIELSNNTAADKTNEFGKSAAITKSFAERQIENARIQSEKSKVSLKSSNSTKTTPPRTPTQIRKIFNSFNACVLGANNNKSVEDLPNEFKSHFEHQLKTVQLKSTGLTSRLEGFKTTETTEGKVEISTKVTANERDERSNSFKEIDDLERSNVAEVPTPASHPRRGNLVENSDSLSKNTTEWARKADSFKEKENVPKSSKEFSVAKKPLPELPPLPAQPPNRNKLPTEKPTIFAKHSVRTKRENGDYDEVKIEEKEDRKIRVGLIEKSASQGHFDVRQNAPKGHQEQRRSWRSSLDYDSVMVRHHHDPDPIKEQPIDFTITIKRDSSTLEPPSDRCSFSTFRSSAGSVKDDDNVVENPLYGLVTQQPSATKLSRQNSISVDAMLLSAKAKGLGDFDLISRPPYRRELSSDRNKFVYLEPVITKLEHAIGVFMGLKRDENYSLIDKLLSKFYVKVDEVPADTAFDQIEKSNLLGRLKQANSDLERRASRNQHLLMVILEEQADMIAKKYNLIA